MNALEPLSGLRPSPNIPIAPEPTQATEQDLSIVLKRLNR